MGAASKMTPAEFKQILIATLDRLIELTDSKGAEYAHSSDQLANFKRLSSRLSLTPEQILIVYLTKHLDAIENYVRNPWQDLSEPIEGRIDDAILYLCLLKALIRDSY